MAWNSTKIPREVPQNFDSDGFGLDERDRCLCPGHGQRNEEMEWEHWCESNLSDLPVWQSIHPEVSNSHDYSICSTQTYVSEPRGVRCPRKESISSQMTHIFLPVSGLDSRQPLELERSILGALTSEADRENLNQFGQTYFGRRWALWSAISRKRNDMRILWRCLLWFKNSIPAIQHPKIHGREGIADLYRFQVSTWQRRETSAILSAISRSQRENHIIPLVANRKILCPKRGFASVPWVISWKVYALMILNSRVHFRH